MVVDCVIKGHRTMNHRIRRSNSHVLTKHNLFSVSQLQTRHKRCEGEAQKILRDRKTALMCIKYVSLLLKSLLLTTRRKCDIYSVTYGVHEIQFYLHGLGLLCLYTWSASDLVPLRSMRDRPRAKAAWALRSVQGGLERGPFGPRRSRMC